MSNGMMQRRITILLYLLSSLMMATCSLSPPEDLPAEDILTRAVERTAQLEGFAFSMVREGTRAYFDPEETVAFRRVEGVFMAPDAVQALVRVVTPGMVSEFQILSLGNQQWFTNVVTGAWEMAPADWSFNPATLFEPESGMAYVLKEDLIDPVLMDVVQIDELPGRDLYYVAADLRGDHIYFLSYGLIASENMQVELWIEPRTFEIHRIVLTENLPNEMEPRVWQLDFWDFNVFVEIIAPEVQGSP
jgi:lipoprotein LprG